MRKLFLILFLSVMGFTTLSADMPGATTFGRQYRQNGRIVNAPNNSNPIPHYYNGSLIYQSPGATYRDSRTGKLQTQTNYNQYPYYYQNVDYRWERQRINDMNNPQNQQYNQSYNPYRNNQPYRNPQQNTYNPNTQPYNPSVPTTY